MFKTKEFWVKTLSSVSLTLIIFFSVMTIVHMPYVSASPEINIDFTHYFGKYDLAPPIKIQLDYKMTSSDDWNMFVRSTQKDISIPLPENAFYRIVVYRPGGSDKSSRIDSHELLNADIIKSYEEDNIIVYEFTTRNQQLFYNEIITLRIN